MAMDPEKKKRMEEALALSALEQALRRLIAVAGPAGLARAAELVSEESRRCS